MRAPRYLLVPFALVIAVSSLRADGWMQLGRSSRHDGNVSVPGQSLDRVLANVTLDPFTDLEEATAGGELLAHYQAPLVDGDDVFIEIKGGTYAGFQSWSSETWTVRDLRWSGDTLAPRWTFTTDWTPVPPGSPNWEPLFHRALTSSFVYAPAAGGTVEKIDRDTGTGIRINPFGTINSST